MYKTLLLTASFGDGHLQVAQALRERLEEHGAEVDVLDLHRDSNRFVARIGEFLFNWTTKYAPFLYGAVYYGTARLRRAGGLWWLLSLFARRKVWHYLQEHHPDLVIQVFPGHALASLPRLQKKPYIGVVVTDYSIHAHWFFKNVDTYFLPEAVFVEEARRLLTDQPEIQTFGLPVRSQFANPHAGGRESPGKQPYVLFATGGRGLFPDLRRILAITHERLSDHELYVLCGRNQAMFDDVRRLAPSMPRVHAVPFVSNMADWMRHARFAVIKSGGMTVAESLAMSCPMLIYRPIPGQERDNALFVERAGAGMIARNPNDYAKALAAFTDPLRYRHMVDQCARVAAPHAAENIVLHMIAKRAGCCQ
jgi:processive 1,2-diacylglycerol beta-glucosyltransferase